jgi:hypothetical protein
LREVYSQAGRDSYHYPEYHNQEMSYQNPPFSSSRGYQRYDPATRRYTEWSIPHDWNASRIDQFNQAHYPRFTPDEVRKIRQRLQRTGRVDPRSMGSEWTTDVSTRARLVLARFSSNWREYPGIPPTIVASHQSKHEDASRMAGRYLSVDGI